MRKAALFMDESGQEEVVHFLEVKAWK